MAAEVGCQHYVRKCLLKAPCCQKFYVCRLCHDDCEDHQMNRFQVKEVKCALCKSIQAAKDVCKECGVKFAEYYCDICHLFDKDKKQYHCEQCGLCRIGPRENYFHCSKCSLCLLKEMQGKHKCVENVSRKDCPICLEDLHTSTIGAAVLPCGHLLHRTCFKSLNQFGSYRCPLCKHSAHDMQEYWEQQDLDIAASPMPVEYRNTRIKILCCDCNKKCIAPYHVLGMKCKSCGSYNTVPEGGLISAPEEGRGGDEEEYTLDESEDENDDEDDDEDKSENESGGERREGEGSESRSESQHGNGGRSEGQGANVD